jgi:N-acetylglucosamine-6-sulfatase
MGAENSTVATWLQDAGYQTALIGKYLNGYEGTYIPPE